MYGKDYGYAKSRLRGSIIRVKDTQDPVLVQDMQGSAVFCSPLLGGDQIMLELDQLDCTPVPLGYCNFEGRAVYLFRKAVRRDWRQGLRDTTLGCPSGRVIVGHRELGTTILGQYPTIKKALSLVKKVRSCAFSRRWALTNGGGLEYMGKVVGSFNEEGELLLGEGYEYLKEVLDAEINKADR